MLLGRPQESTERYISRDQDCFASKKYSAGNLYPAKTSGHRNDSFRLGKPIRVFILILDSLLSAYSCRTEIEVYLVNITSKQSCRGKV